MDSIELVPLVITSNRDGIWKAREAFLISKGKTLKPFWLNRHDEIWSIYFSFAFIYVFWYTFNPFTPNESPFDKWTHQSELDRVKSIKSLLVVKGLIKGDSFLTLSLPRGLPLTSNIIWC